MSAATATLHPLVQWAQRDKILFLTIEVDKIAELNVTDKQLCVKGTYSGSSAEYEAKIDFYADVKPGYRRIPGDRHLELVLDKEASGWWPRLLKDAAKIPWIKVDFNKWKDEDEDEEEHAEMGGFDFNNYMANLGGDTGEAPNLNDFEDEDEDDDEMPELEDADDKEGKSEGKSKEKADSKKEEDHGDSKEENNKPVEQES